MAAPGRCILLYHMANQGPFFFICLLALGATTNGANPNHYSKPFNRSSFPAGFTFGAGSGAYQIEGAALEDGKGPSVWDTFARKYPERIANRSTGDVAVDFYHRYKDDIKLMKKVGLDSFRFSISWSRILPKGKLCGGVNPLGVQFYNNLIDDLLANALKPFVTLLHFDHPQALEDDYGGFLSPKIVDDYVDYADFCFKTFGDRVKHWVTMNEPNGWSLGGANGSAASSPTESYILARHLLLSHAAAVKLYRKKYQASQKGKIGITIITNWFIPKSDATADRKAASRALDFLFGWFVDPLIFGEYPKSMRSMVGRRLPKFTEAESKMLKGSIDFLGVNYYTANYAENAPPSNTAIAANDSRVNLTTEKDGVPIGTPTAVSWLFIYPKGLRGLMLYIKEKYNNPPIYITENGVAEANNASLTVKEALKDSTRIRYLDGHLKSLLKAIREGVNIKGYYVWAFLDDFEWTSGYTLRFGFTYIDFKNNLRRYLKYSAYWFKMFLLH
ncbi:PREDICTED: beta-glucosidase 12 isoform X2 [Theobroma cacao]|uniref:Beta-glucosidase 12 isoform X2 n=1 Tax=Theobroma cacao TaxID=3641 RepID=A0AB32W6J7_THECC|nr:PREDICTED: beta-glucosidase 12 isoform X2 [Theobroma cacao]